MKVKRRAHIWLALFILLLAGCDFGSQPQATPAAVTTATIAPTSRATSTPAPSGKDPVSMLREASGFRVTAAEGNLNRPGVDPGPWLDPTHLFVTWWNDPHLSASYLADLAAGSLRRVTISEAGYIAVSPDAKHVVVLTGNGLARDTTAVRLLDIDSGQAETVFAFDATIPQWADASAGKWSGGELSGTIMPQWANSTALVLTLFPLDNRGMWPWGKVLLVDIAKQKVSTLMESGQVAAVLADGTLLIRPGWIDGPLQAITPPYADPPQTVAPGGPWTEGWEVSPDGKRVAWLEMAPPYGDWSQRLPGRCCSGDPHPLPYAAVVWDGTLTPDYIYHLDRHLVTGVDWPQDTHLAWRKDGTALLYAGHPLEDLEHTALYQLSLMDGKTVALGQHDWYGSIQVNAEGADGSLHYQVSGHTGQNVSTLVRRHPDGQLEILREGLPLWNQETRSGWRVDATGRLIVTENGISTVEDLASGETFKVSAPFDAAISPDSNWVAYPQDKGNLLIVRSK